MVSVAEISKKLTSKSSATVYIYIYIYMSLYVFLEGFRKLFSSGSTIVGLHLPMLELSALTPPIVDFLFRNRSYGNVPMDRGII